MGKTNRFIFACVLLLSLIPKQGLTQDTSNDNTIERIAITANKSAIPINESSHSITVIDSNNIDKTNAQHINQLLSSSPGTWISRGNGQEHLTAIRSPVLTGAGSCGAFFVGIDGIATRAAGFCNANQLFDLPFEQSKAIEVLRSPSSTMYGSNAVHGVINALTADAFNSPNYVSSEIGAYDFIRFLSQHSFLMSDQQKALTIQTNFTQENGYQTESGYDQQKINLIYQSQSDQWQIKTLFSASNLNQETAGFIRGFESYKDESIRKVNPNPEAYRDAKSARIQSSLSREFKGGLFSIKPYFRYNQMAFLQHFLPWQALERNGHRSVGFQTLYDVDFSYQKTQLSWLTGFDTDLTKGWLTETQEDDFSPNIPAGIHYDYQTDSTQVSLYSRLNASFAKWNFSVGLRSEYIAYDHDNKTSSFSACSSEVSVCRFVRPDDQTRSFNALSPSISALYHLNEFSNVYVSATQGYRAPQVTELFRLQNNQQVADINEESIRSFEVGFRYSKEKLSSHLAMYKMNKQDVIFQNSERQNVTGGKSSHFGVELEMFYRFSNSISFSGHLSYAEHLYENNTTLVSDPIKGNFIDTAPKWMSSFDINYKNNDKLNLGLKLNYLSEYFLNPQNTAEYDGHSLIDFYLSYQLYKKVNLSLNVFNLTDTFYAERADFAFGDYRYFIGQGRRAFVRLKWQY